MSANSSTSPPASPLLTEFERALLKRVRSYTASVIASSTRGTHECFVDGMPASSATQSCDFVSPAGSTYRAPDASLAAKLESIWRLAHDEIIEDGMPNTVRRQLPALLACDYEAVIASILSAIQSGKIKPIVAVEALKELGRVSYGISHLNRKRALEYALRVRSAITRDGAGLGLARLADPASLPALRRAVENEPDLETKRNLQLVVDELEG